MDVASGKDIFMPQETLDHPCDVTLVVEDGKEFKAHRQVLSEASPFFEKLLNSDMRESKEGVVRLEMLNESCLGDILEFMYTGSVQILDEENARDLIEMADYLFLPRLKSLAEKVVIQKLDISNCISTYYFAERYQCEELVTDAKQFILANFTTVAKAKEFRNMLNKEVEMCISSDEINVSSEEDVFKIILAWIDHDKSERKKYFTELFRHVRLVYVSREFIRSAIMTNDLVKDNERCLEGVKDAVELIDSKNFLVNFSVAPRKSLQTPSIVVCSSEGYILSYFPREGRWRTQTIDIEPRYRDKRVESVKSMFSCHGQLYFVHDLITISRYDSFSCRLTTLPLTRNVEHMFANNEDEVYALVRDRLAACRGCVSLWRSQPYSRPYSVPPYSLCGKDHLHSITKYNPELNSWEDITTFERLRYGICIVANKNYIYFIGGIDREDSVMLSDSNRYDLSKNKWDKIADIGQHGFVPFGASANGRVFIGIGAGHNEANITCEVYNEATNEWQLIASLKIPVPHFHISMMSVDDKLYVLNGYRYSKNGERRVTVKIQCYDPDMNEWYEKTEYKMPRTCNSFHMSCLMRVFQASRLQKAPSLQTPDSLEIRRM